MKQSFLFKDTSLKEEASSFIVTDSNEAAYNWILNWPKKTDVFATFLLGPSKSGKKKLSLIWGQENNANIVDLNSFHLSEEVISEIYEPCICYLPPELSLEQQTFLFHLFNHLKTKGQHLLFVAEQSIQHYQLELNDLKSRLLTAHIIEISPPDEVLLKALYFKYFHQFGLNVSSDVIDYLSIRFDRTYQSVFDISTILNKQSLLLKRTITIPFVKEILDYK
ncbi:MAG: hypothetical protein KBD31_00255 [Proteobacteria bacterium]|nr:hypothetical protein [Pseudomonadota bacterium]